MGWKIVERRIGRAGGARQREATWRQWDRRYGEGAWEVGYLIDGDFVPQHEALESVYYASYRDFLDAHPEVVEALVTTARALRNPHAEATTGVDLQVPAVERYLKERDLALTGHEVVDIGTWQGQRSHPISERLSPLHLPCAIAPGMTLEKFWQSRKCLAVWED